VVVARWLAVALVAFLAGCLDAAEFRDDLQQNVDALPNWPLKRPYAPEDYVDHFQWNVTRASVRVGDETMALRGATYREFVHEALRIMHGIERRESEPKPLGNGGQALNETDWGRLTFITAHGVPLPNLRGDDPRFRYAYFLFDRSDASHGHAVLCEEPRGGCLQFASERNFQDLETFARRA